MAEFAIPFSKLGITVGEPKTIGIAFCNCWAASDYWPSGADWMDPSTWGAAYSPDYWSSPVGGVQIPIDKLALLAPYIALTFAAVAAALGSMFAGKRWFRNVAV